MKLTIGIAVMGAAAALAAAPIAEWQGEVTGPVDGVFQVKQPGSVIARSVFPVEPGRRYRLSGEFRLAAGSEGALYFGFRELDAERRPILTRWVNIVGGTDTELAAAARKGDTAVRLNNAENWRDIKRYELIAFDAKPDFSDLPNRSAEIGVAEVKDGVATLRTPLDRDYPAGTPVRLHRDRAPWNNCAAAGKALNAQWQTFQGEISGIQRSGTRDGQWRPGTAYAEVVITFNAPKNSGAELDFRNVAVASSGQEVVAKGRPGEDALYNPAAWKTVADFFQCDRPGEVLAARTAWSTAEFTVEAELEVPSLDGSECGLAAGNIVWGLDGAPEAKLFVEGRDFRRRELGSAADLITPGKPFVLTLRGNDRDRTMHAAIDGKPIGECPYLVNRTLNFGIRSGARGIKVRRFEIDGRPGDRESALPVAGSVIDIAQPENRLLLPGWNAAAGDYPATLADSEGHESALTAVIAVDGTVRLPAATLAEVYRNVTLPFLIHPALLTVKQPERDYQCRIVLGDSRRKTDFPKGEVRKTAVGNRIFLDGEPCGVYLSHFDYNGRAVMEKAFSADAVRDFAAAGFTGSLMILAPYKYMYGGKFDLAGFMAEFEQAAAAIAAENPSAQFDIQFFLYTSTDWNDHHRDELIKLDNGKTTLAHAYRQELQPSYASASWRRDMGEIVRQSVAALRRSAFADRIASFRLLYANCGEWNHWGYHEEAYVDYSAPMQQAFGHWLAEQYRTPDALRRAWARPSVDFESADLVPSRQLRQQSEDVVRGGGAVTQPVIDYYRFFQEYAADTILHFAKIVKQSSDNRLLTGAYYGYYKGHYFANPYHFQDSGHYATWKMIRSPYIDFIGGPNSYYLRGAIFDVNAPAASVSLHGKIWICEEDIRTHRSGPKPHIHQGITANQAETSALLTRDFAGMLASGTVGYFYDFIAGWYRDPETMELIGKLARIDRARSQSEKAADSAAEVAILLSESVIPYCSGSSAANLVSGERRNLGGVDFWGIPVDYYLESDIDRIDFDRYRAVIFYNSFYFDEELLNRVRERVAKNNRTLIFLYAPGIVDAANTVTAARSRELTGIGLTLTPPAPGTPLTTTWQRVSCKEPYLRFTAIDDPDATVLATFADGKPAAAERRFKDYRSIVICHPFPDTVFMRDLLSRNKVHVYSSGKSGFPAVYVAPPLIGVFSRKGGAQTLTLREPVEIAVDLIAGTVLGRNTAQIDFELPKEPHTVLLYTGTLAEYERLYKEAE